MAAARPTPLRETYLPQPILDYSLGSPRAGSCGLPHLRRPQLDATPDSCCGQGWELSTFGHAVAYLDESATAQTPTARFGALLVQYRRHVGRTQWEHLTDHSYDVAAVATLLGRALGLESAELGRLRVAGLLHDIGKLLIPERVLAKPGRLSAGERRLIDRHTEDGALMGALLGMDSHTAALIRHHHAHYNARGGPGAAPADRVPLGAHILAAADALTTMTSPRPYQAARSARSALDELRRHGGRQFDPLVVAACERCAPFGGVRAYRSAGLPASWN